MSKRLGKIQRRMLEYLWGATTTTGTGWLAVALQVGEKHVRQAGRSLQRRGLVDMSRHTMGGRLLYRYTITDAGRGALRADVARDEREKALAMVAGLPVAQASQLDVLDSLHAVGSSGVRYLADEVGASEIMMRKRVTRLAARGMVAHTGTTDTGAYIWSITDRGADALRRGRLEGKV